MRFDVIVGNPPYQLNDGGGLGSSAVPIYDKFVKQAKKLQPRYLAMIIPSRWFTGGRGLDEFRAEMLNDDRLRILHDYPNSNDCFAGVVIEGGVCYFLWDRDNRGASKIYTHQNNKVSESERPLLEEGSETFIRYNEGVSVLRKVREKKEKSFSELVSANDPFGFDVRVQNSYKRIRPIFKKRPFVDGVKVFYYGYEKDGAGYINVASIRRNTKLVDQIKVYVSKAYGMGSLPTRVINRPFVGEGKTCCTETYLVVGPFRNKEEANNVVGYMQTKFFRFLVFLIKNTQNGMKKVYSFVPSQNFAESWTDEKLYKKYGLTQKEIEFIESVIAPM